MEPLSSLFNSNERKAQKRPIPVITIDDNGGNDKEESVSATVKREKIEAKTPSIEDETSLSFPLKDDGETKDELHGFIAAEVLNPSNLTIDGDVQLLKDLIQDILKEHSLIDEDKTSAQHFDVLNGPEAVNNNNNNEIIRAPNFQLEAISTGGKRLVIFVSNDKTMCYKLYAYKNSFFCPGCRQVHKKVKAKLFKDENGEDFVEMKNQHFCKPVKYVPPSEPQLHEIINAPNYELQVKLNGYPKLVIFVPSNPNLCYYYKNERKNYFICCECKKTNKKTISAKLLKDQDGSEYVQANVPHLCKPVPYIANTSHVIKAPNFFVFQLYQTLVVFNLDHPSLCYRYYYNKAKENYNCITCLNVHQKNVTAKVIKEENGEECLQVNKNHLCEHFTYKISDVFDILKSPNFTLINNENNGSSSILRVYASNVLSTCYIFTQMGSSYACSGCLSNGKHFLAKLFKDESGEEVVLLWKDQIHVCVPITCG